MKMNYEPKSKVMKKISLLFLLFYGLVAINTANAQVYSMIIDHSGGPTCHPLDDVQIITFTSTDLNANVNATIVPYVMGDVNKITFDLCTVGINEEVASSVVAVYPNPTTGVVTLDINNETATEFVVNIYNVTGALVSSNTYPAKGGLLNETINLSSYVDGIYLIRINSGNDIITKKIIKNN